MTFSDFSLKMKLSGYLEQFIFKVISSGVACYEKQLARAVKATCPLYRAVKATCPLYRPKGYKE